MKRFTWIFCVLAAAALGAPVREIPRDVPFRLERAIACRGQADGEPVDPGVEFVLGDRAMYVWFSGQAGTRATPLEAVVTRDQPPRVVAVRQLYVPRGSDGGLVSLSLSDSRPLAPGAYRVSLAGAGRSLAVDFAIVSPGSLAAPARIECDPEGFSLVPPAGWQRATRDEVALVLLRTAAPEASAVVMVRHEPVPATVAEVADRVASALVGDETHRVLRRVMTRVAGRACVALWFDTPGGIRSKVVVLPREGGERTRAFFGVIVSANSGGFARVEEEFDRMLETFRVITPGLP